MDRKFFGGICLLTAAVAISSCSSDDVINNEEHVVSGAQTISLAVANTGDNFVSTRAARPLYSSAAKQDINKVKVVIYRLGDTPNGVTDVSNITEWTTLSHYGEMTIVAQKVFSPWMNSGVSSVYNNATYGNGRQASWTLATADQITQEGVYLAYAVGYNDSEYSALNTTSGFGALSKSTTGSDVKFTFPLSVAQTTKGESETVAKVYEIFAGSAPFIVTKKEVGEEGNKTTSYQFDVALTLHRQVAGTIGYFTNIPVKGNADHATATGTKLRLVASNKSDNAVFAAFNSAYIGGDGVPATETTSVKYVVNGWDNETKTASYDAKFYGSSENDAYTVYEVTLKDWFTGKSGESSKMDTNEDGILNGKDTFTNPYSSKGLGVKTGCVLGSSFLFPFALVAEKATFQLQMLSEDGTIIRYWNIRLQTSTSDSQIGKKATLVKSDGSSSENGTEENVVNYSILRNHLYNIGTRNGGDGGTDGNDDDKAQDLNNETLILRVNDNWEMIHQMDID